MGCVGSKAAYSAGSGTEAEYKSTFTEKNHLGRGEFGVVKLVVKKSGSDSEPYAVKVLNKGFSFKDNVVYTPMKPEALKMEIDILRVLGGKKFNLGLDSVYESSSKLYIVTEICTGGEMLEYTSDIMAEGLRTEEVSRIAYQLLSAVDHCDRHNILHRDIKPENIMFKANTRTAELRLIDFGCATMDRAEDRGKMHNTFAGTPFYISPEMFQKMYTTRTDVFSTGVVLYVLVAGYPAQNLQAAFNLLQKADRDLKTLPGMPEDMPETYYEMLDKMLAYRWKRRKRASEMLEDEFVMFHQALENKNPAMSKMRTPSVVLSGTGEKAADAFGFVKFQRSLTLILATILGKGDLESLLSYIEAKVSADDSMDSKLGVIEVKDIKSFLHTMGKHTCVAANDCVARINQQKNAQDYDNYSYEYTLLKPLTQANGGNNELDSSTRSVRLSKKARAAKEVIALSSSERIPRKRRSKTSVYL
mmetsp:Transcript_337/g.657  ORF Transcript_337/g.657 Transcript_337/m.657 type:complete len:474 (-) Transcript_337:470-1891(-)|eukprot:CAMPEP_0201628432 /NCGR_PEP_ID=MMETSP0493-20130528/3380_1 /ASSEMBLY_ACC=CAM_ASM_000838 /TAXON_ID=420259 /ORGANISM="Thalassiosira gravida, Strain GMp14c1" /LENGTH=473 /DNA_ID=CAMNT_0048099191 /DNA_START=173 /DNA_END=1597 /DNA_ORIENTATION=+